MAATVGIVTTVLQCRQGLIVWLSWGKCPVLQSLLSKGENNYIADQLTRGTFMFERKLDFHRVRKKSITAKGKARGVGDLLKLPQARSYSWLKVSPRGLDP